MESQPKGRARGGKARADALSAERKKEIATQAAKARWSRTTSGDLDVVHDSMQADLPVAKYRGVLDLLGIEIPCYVLGNGLRVIGRTSMTEMLTGIKGGGGLEKYLGVSSLTNFINIELVLERMVAFRLPEVEGLEKAVKGLPADLAIDVCRGFVDAMQASYTPEYKGAKMTARQVEMAIKASMFVAACAKVGLEALIDEATGAQYDREEFALQLKLNAYLEEEMRKWEKTFPDDLWLEFGRLTGWKGSVIHRPKYWGKLVNELIYEQLDKDVTKWLKEHAPTPKHGQNYHQWLSGQFGLKRLVEVIWMVIGMAKSCENMTELRDRIAALKGKTPVQLRLYLPATENLNPTASQPPSLQSPSVAQK
jgi:P63C domain